MIKQGVNKALKWGIRIYFSDSVLNLDARMLCCEVASGQISVYQVWSRAHRQCHGCPVLCTVLPLPSMESLEGVSHFLAEILQARGELFPTNDTPASILQGPAECAELTSGADL